MRLLGLKVRDTVTGYTGIATEFYAELGGSETYKVEVAGKPTHDEYGGCRIFGARRLEEVAVEKRVRKPRSAAAPAPKARAKKG